MDVMFLDADQFVVGKINGIDATKKLGVSPHYMPKRITDRYGYYNAGMVWTNSQSVVERWIQLIPGSRFVDQACVENLAKEFPHFIFGPEYNIQSYRFTQGIIPQQKYMGLFKVQKNKLLLSNKEIKTFHTHFKKKDSFAKINAFIQGMLAKSKKWREVAIIDRMLDQKWRLIIPKQPTRNPHFRHANDSYRMYPRLWQKQNMDVVMEENPHRQNCWLGNAVMMYDRPTLQWMNEESKVASMILMGNGGKDEIKTIQTKYNTNVKSWIFWPRDIGVYLETRTNKTYDERNVGSIFIGNFENPVQQKHRQSGDWSGVIEEFHLTGGHKHLFTKQQYVQKIGNAKYGLCLRGFGSKCHREVELMGVGTVPIVTPGVEIDSYADPPKEGVHYIRVSHPNEIRQKLSTISQTKWVEMSVACVEWFNRNLTWQNTIQTILFK